MRRYLLPLFLLASVACSTTSGPPPASLQTTPSTSPSAGVTVLPSASPSSSPAPPVMHVAFTCRLPVITLTYGAESNTYQGGFISFPSGAYAADPKGVITFKSGFFVTQQTPALIGGPDELTPPFFDVAAGRWVPSSAGETAPDGSSYAYANTSDPSTGAAIIHVVNVRSGTEKTFHVAIPIVAASGIEVVDYDGAGVYFVANQIDSRPTGVWRLDVATGKVAALAQTGNVLAVRGGYAWVGALDPHDSNPPQAGSRPLFDSIAQVNLSNGAQTTWFHTPGRSETLLGLVTNGNPVLNISDAPDYPVNGGEVRLLDHPSSGAEDSGQLVSGSGMSLSQPQGDGDRTWFAGDGGIYLYTQAAGLQRVFSGPANPKTGGMISPAGFCR
ncbi:MAG TPA: hypothetical protein VFL29_01155 [Candidatus Dormibacteraeota bacterium]|nr:hypothetical protein [Candidatus Dormibacteraeota bacterium]